MCQCLLKYLHRTRTTVSSYPQTICLRRHGTVSSHLSVRAGRSHDFMQLFSCWLSQIVKRSDDQQNIFDMFIPDYPTQAPTKQRNNHSKHWRRTFHWIKKCIDRNDTKAEEASNTLFMHFRPFLFVLWNTLLIVHS